MSHLYLIGKIIDENFQISTKSENHHFSEVMSLVRKSSSNSFTPNMGTVAIFRASGVSGGVPNSYFLSMTHFRLEYIIRRLIRQDWSWPKEGVTSIPEYL